MIKKIILVSAFVIAVPGIVAAQTKATKPSATKTASAKSKVKAPINARAKSKLKSKSSTGVKKAAALPSAAKGIRENGSVDFKHRESMQPEYPRDLLNAGIGGQVKIGVDIDAKGNLVAARVASSSGRDALDAAALDSARRSRFVAAKDASGRPKASTVMIDYEFTPEEEDRSQ